MSHRVQVSITGEEWDALSRLASAERRSLGKQAAVMLAPLLTRRTLGPWEKHPVESSGWIRRTVDGSLCAGAWRTANGWRWWVHHKEGAINRGATQPCPDADTAMHEADAAIGEGT